MASSVMVNDIGPVVRDVITRYSNTIGDRKNNDDVEKGLLWTINWLIVMLVTSPDHLTLRLVPKAFESVST
jgi:hypothetical protein